MQLLAIWGRYAVAYCGLRSTAPHSDALSLTRAVDALSDDVFAQGATGLTDAAVNDLGEVRFFVCIYMYVHTTHTQPTHNTTTTTTKQ